MISEKCFISYNTVNSHVKNIYKKLQVNSVAEAVSKAIKEQKLFYNKDMKICHCSNKSKSF